MSNGSIENEFIPSQCDISDLEDAVYGKDI
jgi:hypothetical protein